MPATLTPMLFDARRAQVVTPDGAYEPVRVIFKSGRAAIWEVDDKAMTARRLILLTDATFTKRARARDPHLITVGETVWQVYPKVAGCGCGQINPLKRVPYSDLLGDDFTHFP